MTKFFFVFALFFSLLSNVALAEAGGSAALIDGRLKVQFSVQKEQSKGSFQLRSILQRHGFQEEDGFVRTGNALAPLEIYNYLYEDGRYVFTLYLPVDGRKFFVSFNEKGFVSFSGPAAKALFDVVKLYAPRTGVEHLEQYKWTEGSYCDRTTQGDAAYRCWIER
jgi:hypothetical protein